MIPPIPATKDLAWQPQLSQVVSNLDELLKLLNLEKTAIAADLNPQFPLRVPLSYVLRMEKENPNDPLLLQVLPQLREKENAPQFTAQPLQEEAFSPTSGILHKYHGRVLWLISGSCAIHCRYCFRQNFPYSAHVLSKSQWEKPLQYIAQEPSIHEVILSGGDPLNVNDAYFSELIHRLEGIDHVQTLRIHTRLPIVIPARITDALLARLSSSRLQIVVAFHINHPNEINEEVIKMCLRLHEKGFLLLNQSVLLRQINDSIPILTLLSHRLWQAKVLPYYIHLLDPVSGSAHFEVSAQEAAALQQQLLAQLPGYLVPKFVVEQPGAKSKTLLSSY